MKKRAVISFCLIIVFTFGMTFRVLYLTEGEQLAQAAQRQSTYRLDVAETRGTIYDCNQLPLTNSKKVWKAVVFPTPMALSGLSDVLGRLEAKQLWNASSQESLLLLMFPLKSGIVKEFTVSRFLSIIPKNRPRFI